MSRQRTIFATALALLVLPACGDETEEATGGGDACSVEGQPDLVHACSCCDAGDVCETVQAVTTFYRCVVPVVPGPGEFSCGPATVCLDDQICEIRSPVGDGSNQYDCLEPPAACENDLSCACLEGALDNVSECTEEDGHFTVSGSAI